MRRDYDIIVIGGGHAGAEAAWASARLGARTALVTFERGAIGRMSCNPAIGGIGKGQMVREIDALGGLMGQVSDRAGIQFRMLNRRKGPAVWAPRAQCDRDQYAATVQGFLADCRNLEIVEAGVEDLLVEPAATGNGDGPARSRIAGVRLHDGRTVRCGAAIVTSGTFLRGLMHTGETKTAGGRVGEQAATGLSGALQRLGLRLGRLKTGTPPRVHRDTVDYSKLKPQPGDDPPRPFSFLTEALAQRQIDCWISFTNAKIHELIRANLHRAPMYSGQIASRGPRYCPSIEDKVVRFADRDRHQVFLEPEGYDNERVYVNGISTSLPEDVQRRIVALIPGLEDARILQLGYAVEYDFVPPEQIDASLMTKPVAGLYLAGQINGTSGYEEAAGQGLLAGVNAARRIAGAPPVVLGRDQAYIGVMVDDLVTSELLEPYRMFTSRAEHRMHLRYDNADLRLTPIGRAIGLVDADRWERFERKRERREALLSKLDSLREEGRTLRELLQRPETDAAALVGRFPDLRKYFLDSELWTNVTVEIRYAGYIARQSRVIERFRELEGQAIPADLAYERIPHLRAEARERLEAVRPRSLGQAARVAGIRPTDVTLLMVAINRR